MRSAAQVSARRWLATDVPDGSQGELNISDTASAAYSRQSRSEGGPDPQNVRPLKILFVSRAHPPVVGGIENQNEALGGALAKLADVTAIVNRGGKKALPYFLPWAALHAAWIASGVDVILLGDGVAAFIGWFVKRIRPGKSVVCVVHGLDLTYRNPVYQRLWVGRFLPALDHLIAVSRSTRHIAVQHGLDGTRVSVVPNGIDVAEQPSTSTDALENSLGVTLRGRSLLVTVGRLVRRKGVAWFVEEVLPSLPDSVLYIAAGEGPDREEIERIIKRLGLSNRALVLGRVSEDTKRAILGNAHLFIQPNIPVPGDVEGFGIAVLEAGCYGLPVVATRLEGLQDAVEHGTNGLLVPPQDPPAMVRAIAGLLIDEPERLKLAVRARSHVEQFDWNIVAQKYLSTLVSVAGAHRF